MPRAKGGPKTRRRRKKILKQAKGYVGGRRKLYRTAAETVLRAGAFAYRAKAEEAPPPRPLDHPHQRRVPAGRALVLAVHGRAQEGRDPARSQGPGRDGGARPPGVREARRDRQGAEPVVRGPSARRRERAGSAGGRRRREGLPRA